MCNVDSGRSLHIADMGIALHNVKEFVAPSGQIYLVAFNIVDDDYILHPRAT